MYIPATRKFALPMLLLLFALWSQQGWSQCAGVVSTPRGASECAAHKIPAGKIATLDSAHAYSLAELVDIAEHNNPRTRVFWTKSRLRNPSLRPMSHPGFGAG
jgi:hypothetical protein